VGGWGEGEWVGWGGRDEGELALPDFEFEGAVFSDEFEVGAIGSDEACAVGAGGEGDEHVEVEVAELAAFEAVVADHVAKNLT